MRSAAAFVASQPELFAPASTPATFAPWDYIRMRRESAGLTIEKLADRIGGRPELRDELIENLRFFEKSGVRLKNVQWHSYHKHFLFDPEVYRQLAEHKPNEHPQLCRSCGWDRWTEQEDEYGFATTWSTEDPTICTRCEQRAGARRR